MPGRDLNLLSLDGGGIRGLSSLQILKQLMENIKLQQKLNRTPKPCEYFDMIGGSSTGRLIAIMLGRLKMDVDKCIETYVGMSDRIFRKTRHRVKMTNGHVQGKLDSQELERAVKEIIVNAGLDENALLLDEPGTPCKVWSKLIADFVCATSTHTSETVLLTSYERRRAAGNRLKSVKIWEACRATSAATSFYDPIQINLGTHNVQFVDGGTGANNPIRVLWNEAKDAWYPELLENNLKCLISIGTGASSVEPFKVGLINGELLKTLARIATETEQTAESFQRDHSELDDNGHYFRFNVSNGLQNIGLEDSAQKDEIMAITDRYLESQEVFRKLHRCCFCLAEREFGSGKTVLTTAVIETVTASAAKSGTATLYFYCEAKSGQPENAISLFESWIKQLLTYLSIISKPCPSETLNHVKRFYSTIGLVPDLDDVIELFQEILSAAPGSICIIDGLDEFQDKDIERTLKAMKDLLRSNTGQQVNFFVTSRRELHVGLMGLNTIHVPIGVHNVQADIKAYIQTTISEKGRQLTTNNALMGEVKARLMSDSDGMFLWVHLQIEAIWEDCYTDDDIHRALNSLPKGLDETYSRCLERINRKPENLRRYAPLALRWVACASRPLLESEFEEAVAFDLADRRWTSAKVPSCSSIIESCASLIIRDATDRRVRFAHFSVGHFLQGKTFDHSADYHFDPQQGKLGCGEYCVNYLSFSDFSLQVQPMVHLNFTADLPRPIATTTQATGILGSTIANLLSRRRSINPPVMRVPIRLRQPQATPTGTGNCQFLQYARQNWAHDTKLISTLSPVWERFIHLALEPNLTWNLHPWAATGQSLASHFQGLLGYAVQLEHLPLLNLLFTREARDASAGKLHFSHFCNLPLDASEGGLSAFHIASRVGNLDIVKVLLPYSNVNMQDEYGNTALHYAAEKGHLDVAKAILSQKDAKIDLPNKENVTAVWFAASIGNADLVTLLVQRRASINTQSLNGYTTADIAAVNGHANVILVLLSVHKVSQNSKLYFERALFRASQSKQWDIIVLLCRHGIDTELRHISGNTPLTLAAKSGQVDVVEKLLGLGASIEARNDNGQTALHLAVSHHELEVARTLLSRHAKTDSRDSNGLAPLHLLSGNDGLMTLTFHVAAASLEVADDKGLTPLHCAAAKGLTKEVETIIKMGCQIDPLASWSPESHLKLPFLSGWKPGKLKESFDYNRSLSGLTPMHLAAVNGQAATVARLAELGYEDSTLSALHGFSRIDALTHSAPYFSPLHLAVISGNLATIQQTIQHGARVDHRHGTNPTSLHLAVSMGDLHATEILLRAGADLGSHFYFRERYVKALRLVLYDPNLSQSSLETAALLIKQAAWPDASCLNASALHAWAYDSSQADWSSLNSVLCKLPPLSNDVSSIERTPLSMSVISGNSKATKLLLQYGFLINAKDRYGATPLSYAIITRESERAALFLLEEGADPNALYGTGDTMLHLAVLFNKPQVAAALLAREAIITKGGVGGHMPSDYIGEGLQYQRMRTVLARRSKTKFLSVPANAQLSPGRLQADGTEGKAII